MINLRRDISFKASLARNWLIQVFWWIIFFPGFFSTDSFAAVDMARSGNLTNAYTASWAIYVRLFSFHGHFIGLVTLIDGLVLVYAVTRFAYSIFEDQNAATGSFVLTLTPVVWAMGITLWHDIPMTSGLLLIVTFFTKYGELKSAIPKIPLLDMCLGSALITFRPNGLPTALLFLIILLLIKKSKIKIRYVAFSGFIAIAFTLTPSYLFLKQSPINAYYAQEWMRNDISCFLSKSDDNNFVEKYLKNSGNTSDWSSQNACKFLNNYSLNQEEIQKSLSTVPRAWFQLALGDPIFILKTHAERNAYLLPIPINGFPKTPFLHSNIQYVNKDVSWLMPQISEKARKIVRFWNALRMLFGWTGLWLISMILIRKEEKTTITILMSITLMLLLFVFAPIPDGRYALFVLISGQLIVSTYLYKLFNGKNVNLHKKILKLDKRILRNFFRFSAIF